MALTIEDLRQQVLDGMMTEQAEPPASERVIRALDRAKNDAVLQLERIDPSRFAHRIDYSVLAGELYITLPDGSDPDYPPVRRILGVATVVSDAETSVRIYDRRDPSLRMSEAGFWMYREADRLYFSSGVATGHLVPVSYPVTLRLRYAAQVPNADPDDLDANYAVFPDEWLELIAMQATADLLPYANPGRRKWLDRRNERLRTLVTVAPRLVRDGPATIQYVE